MFESDIVALCNLCLVSMETSSETFKMHSLIQLAMRKQHEANRQLEW